MAARHENIEGAVGRFENHDAGVENGLVVTGGRQLWEMEEDVEAAEDDDVGVDEDHPLVLRQLPQPELAVVVLVVGAVLGPRVPDPGDDSDLPAGELEGAALDGGDGAVEEEHQVAFGSRAEERLRQHYCAANVAFRRVKNRRVGLAFRSSFALNALFQVRRVVHLVDS